MPYIPLIGITGRARSGKDTVADFILQRNGGYKYSFAEPLKQMLLPLGIDMSEPYWQEVKEVIIPEFNASPRRLMQTLGTEWGRELIHPDLWLTLATRKLASMGHGMVIPDVRFENEAAWVRRNGGVIIHLFRSHVDPVEKHVSEAGITMDTRDYMLDNNRTFEELRTEVIRLIHRIKHGL